jgi:hypothetical protein
MVSYFCSFFGVRIFHYHVGRKRTEVMERVSITSGKQPILIVSPHGYKNDDENTATVAEAIASVLNCYAVINRGWERADDVDIFNDKADLQQRLALPRRCCKGRVP